MGGGGWLDGQTHRHLNIKKNIYNQRGFVIIFSGMAACYTSRESKEDVQCLCYCNDDLPGECET